MIRSYKNAFSEKIAAGVPQKNFPLDLRRIAQRKLIMMEAATELRDLQNPPGNQLEALKNKGKHKNRQGQYSIRINKQWRICFTWREDGVYDVEIIDYH